jgi:putative MFS transporter
MLLSVAAAAPQVLLRCVLIGLPIWFVVGILVTGGAGVRAGPSARRRPPSRAATPCSSTYVGLAVLATSSSGVLSQWVGSRAQGGGWASCGHHGGCGLVPHAVGGTRTGSTRLRAMGFGIGYWAVFVTIAAEQFGTNLRATVTTSVPNFVRGSVPLLTASFKYLRAHGMTLVGAAAVLGAACMLIALASLWGLEETHGKDLDYSE